MQARPIVDLREEHFQDASHLELAHNGLDRPRTLAPNTLSSHAAIDDTPSPALTPITHSSWKLVQTPAAYEASGFNNRQSLPKTPDHLRMGTEWTTDNTVYEQFVTSTSPGPSTGGSEGGKTKKMRETRIYGYKGNEPEKELKKTKRAQQNREAQRAFRARKEIYVKTLEAQLNQTGSTPDPHMIRYQHVLGQRYILSLINRLEEHKVDVPDAPFGLRLDKSLALDDSHDREVTPHLAESHANPMQHSIPGGHVEQHHYTSPGGHMEQDHHTIQQGHLEASAAQAQAINEQTGHGDLNHICAQGSSGESELERRINGELCKDRSWDEGPDLTMRRNG